MFWALFVLREGKQSTMAELPGWSAGEIDAKSHTNSLDVPRPSALLPIRNYGEGIPRYKGSRGFVPPRADRARDMTLAKANLNG